MLEKLLPPELVRTMNEAQNDPSWVPPETDVMRIYNGLDGSIMKEMPIPRTVRVSRRKMRAHCSRGIDVKVRLRVIRSLGYSFTAAFSRPNKSHSTTTPSPTSSTTTSRRAA
jgi:hypothetical protein